ncbi:hydrogenase expression/formation protein HupK [Thalassobius sp. S69A]|uniref:hydrogenase expression/formation protein HupK n=1 Tax=unclassified Thalassovita TaxID=2619711 RepID=UPI000C3640A1|nr:hydrogenase expression/formation protein HupK [Paracoccaceae bacterium]
MLDRPDHTRLIARPAKVLPVAQLVRGKRIEEVADLLPRLFNLCRAAQRAAVRAALGLEVTAADMQAVRREIQREHELRLSVLLPLAFGLPAGEGLRLFPATPQQFEAFMLSDDPLARLLRRVGRVFGPGRAVAQGLELPTAENGFTPGAVENSVAARVAQDPVMRHVQARHGRGPLWRTVARAVELRKLTEGWQPRIQQTPWGVLAPAARGVYALTATLGNDRVETFHRVTPTDHLLASGGILQASLDTLPDRAHADKLLAILDPCSPVTLTEVPAHA